jgi:hypothetical protein
MYKSRVGLTISLLSSSTLATTRGLRPALFLNFLSGSLDSRVGFSRGTNATMVDSTGRIVYAPANLLLRSQEFDNAAWTKSNTTVTPNVSDPLGGTTADTVTATTANGHILQQVVLGAGINAIPSIWVRRRTGTGTINMWNATGTTVNVTSQITTSWSRVFVPPVACSSGPFLFLQIVTSGDAVDVWGAQLEPVTYQTTPGPYVATTASAYYGPRFDFDPFTLGALGLLIEEQRTNLLTYSEQFDNAAWANAAPSSTVTVAANNTAAPDGTTTADRLTAATGGTNAMARQFKTLVASTVYTGSLFVKASTATQSRLLLRDTTAGTNFADATLTWTAGVPSVAGGATGTWSVTNFGNDWYRVTGTGTTGASASPDVTFSVFPDTSAGTNAIFAWGAQLEAGAFATSYIPTVASQVTRNADVATMTGTNFSGWYNQTEGTFVAEISLNNAPAVATFSLYSVSDNTANERIFVGTGFGSGGNINALVTDGGVLQAQTINGGLASAGLYKYGNAYAANDFASVANGGSAVTDASGTLPTVDRLYIGASAVGTAPINGHIRQIAYFNTRLPNAQLETLSSPSLVPTLVLDFTASSYASGY